MLSKVLPLAIYPIGIALILGLMAFVLTFRSRRRMQRLVLLALLTLLWISSMPRFADWAIGGLEAAYLGYSSDGAPNADVAILLGGALSDAPASGQPDVNDAVDRVLLAARLYRAGKVSMILVSGGNLDWNSAGVPEAQMIADLLVELGVPRTALVLENSSRDTHENAVNCAAIVAANGWGEALLVTSAWHMPRAVAAFEEAGVSVIPAPTDFRNHAAAPLTVLDFLPDADALARTTTAIKEWIGLLYYRIRGWA